MQHAGHPLQNSATNSFSVICKAKSAQRGWREGGRSVVRSGDWRRPAWMFTGCQPPGQSDPEECSCFDRPCNRCSLWESKKLKLLGRFAISIALGPPQAGDVMIKMASGSGRDHSTDRCLQRMRMRMRRHGTDSGLQWPQV
jgi:hypothetical protein